MAVYGIVRKGTGMESAHLRHLLEQVRGRRIDLDSAMQKLKHLPFDDLGYAKVDNHRCIRTGVPPTPDARNDAPSRSRNGPRGSSARPTKTP